MTVGKTLLGIMASIAIGAVLGITYFLGPRRSRKLKNQIVKTGSEFSDELESKFKELQENINSKFEMVREEANRIAENGRLKVDHSAKVKV